MSDFAFQFMARLIVLMTAIPIHESAHGLVAYWLGDPTAKNEGRISLIPWRHFDLLGTGMLLLAGFGWAKPVPINTAYFKKAKRGMAFSALAGPVSNLLLAYLAMVLYKILMYAGYFNGWNGDVMSRVLDIIFYVIMINVGLAIFNLLPFPPLDGSRIFSSFLPDRVYFGIMRYEKFIFIGVLVLIYTGLLDAPLSFINEITFRIMDFLTSFIDVIAVLLSNT